MRPLKVTFIALTFLCLVIGCASNPKPAKVAGIPVIFDTDIGDDIDDTWALGFLLRSPELDVKLVVGDDGKSEYRAKLLAKFLETAGRTDIPVGIGMEVPQKDSERQREWVKDYDLKKYPGKVYADGVQAIIDTIMKSPTPITVIAVGPVQNIAEALKREPRIAQRARFVGMHGSVRVGYNNDPKITPEYNVRVAPQACQVAFTAPWDITITPLDTCDKLGLSGEKYQRVFTSADPIAKAVIENYRLWAIARKQGSPEAFPLRSTTLFDVVAVYLAFNQEWCGMENIGIRVTDEGLTVEDPNAKKMNVALTWKNLPALEDLLVKRLTAAE
ncbi:MAG TPA: nucleoside hydrolase [Verrucomicrobiae bacterium]|nr:nucleoside hydrolase [Verrucomicrobiae bacterium]